MWNIFALFFILHILLSANAELDEYYKTLLSSQPCSVTWKPYHHDKSPLIDGFKIGKNQRNHDIYVGKGPYSHQFGPGNIQIEGETGFYFPCYWSERYILHDIYYLSVVGDCKCEFIPQPIRETTPGLITIKDKDHVFYVGLHKFPGSKYSTIGKVVSKTGNMYFADNGVEKITRDFAALTCVPNFQ